jgi:hypothetical protein
MGGGEAVLVPASDRGEEHGVAGNPLPVGTPADSTHERHEKPGTKSPRPSTNQARRHIGGQKPAHVGQNLTRRRIVDPTSEEPGRVKDSHRRRPELGANPPGLT